MDGPRAFGKADLHIHSDASDGLATVSEILEYVEHETDLDLIAITDHDTLSSALKARDLAAQKNYRFDVLVGMEISTLEGHLLAYDLEESIPMMRPLADTIREAHDQGGFCIVPHPMSWLVRSVGRNGLLRIHRNGHNGVHLDGIELLSPSIAGQVAHGRASTVNEEVLRLPVTGGSDAHFLTMIGAAYTSFNGRTAADFRKALAQKGTAAGGRFWTLEDHARAAGLVGQILLRNVLVLPGRYILGGLNSLRER